MTEDDKPKQDDIFIQSFERRPGDYRTKFHHRELVRKTLAFRLFWLVSALTVTLVIATGLRCISLDSAKDIFGIMVAPLVGVFATTVGFYFGSEKPD